MSVRVKLRGQLAAARKRLADIVAGNGHVCTCDSSPGIPGCSAQPYDDRCRFEHRAAALEVAALELLTEASTGRPSTASWLAHSDAIRTAAEL